MFNPGTTSSNTDFDSERIREDPEYRQEVLDSMAADSRSRRRYRQLYLIIQGILGLALFTVGLLLGGRIGWDFAFWVSLMVVCFLVIPLMAWLLVIVRRYREDKNNSSLS